MLPLDNNNYVNSLKAQTGYAFRRVNDVSRFFTQRLLNEEEYDGNPAINQEGLPLSQLRAMYAGGYFPDLGNHLGEGFGDIVLYQLYFALGPVWNYVSDPEVISIGENYVLVPSGVELTVEQNGDAAVPGEETFVPFGEPQLYWVGEIDGDLVALPYNGKMWFGNVNFTAEPPYSSSGLFAEFLCIMADGTFYMRRLDTLPDAGSPILFTHVFSSDGEVEVYFTGKEIDLAVADLPTEYVEPDITFVPDEP